jgi:NADP-dependent 3-hydroxy acid dehydrogenase YdfG
MENANTWLVTGVTSGFGNELAKQLLAAGKTVIDTVRSTAKVEDLLAEYPDMFEAPSSTLLTCPRSTASSTRPGSVTAALTSW